MRLTSSAGTFVYPMRVVGYMLVLINVYLTRLPEKSWDDAWVWGCILTYAIYPHLAFKFFIEKPNTKTELQCLMFDMLLIGFTSGVLFFNPVLFLPYLIGNSSANYAIRGPKFMVKGLIAFAIGFAVSLIVFNKAFRLTFQFYELIPTYLYLIASTHYIGYISYVRGLVLMKAKDRAEVMANHDALTRLANRRRFDSKLEQVWQAGYQAQTPVSVLALDIDYFKAYNDLYGHLSGDDCLYKVAQGIAANIADDTALVARTGGEEFSIILPNTRLEEAALLAQKILKAIQGLNIEHQGSKIGNIVTISIGVASVTPVSSFSSRGLMLATDQALYQAKEDGRNCVSIKRLFNSRQAKAL